MYLGDSLRKLQQDGEDEDRAALALQHGTAIQRDDSKRDKSNCKSFDCGIKPGKHRSYGASSTDWDKVTIPFGGNISHEQLISLIRPHFIESFNPTDERKSLFFKNVGSRADTNDQEENSETQRL